jgi:hypothetical protein
MRRRNSLTSAESGVGRHTDLTRPHADCPIPHRRHRIARRTLVSGHLAGDLAACRGHPRLQGLTHFGRTYPASEAVGFGLTDEAVAGASVRPVPMSPQRRADPGSDADACRSRTGRAVLRGKIPRTNRGSGSREESHLPAPTVKGHAPAVRRIRARSGKWQNMDVC